MSPVPERSTPAFASLLAVVEQVRREPADPDADPQVARVARDVDAADWLKRWLETPTRGMGGIAPWEFITTPDGVEHVRRALLSELRDGYW